MRHPFVTTLAVLALLLQGIGAAWAAPMRIAAQAAQAAEAAEAAEAASATPAAMPCHDEPQADAAAPDETASPCPCCEDGGLCSQLCASAAAAALPVHAPDLQDYLDAHFESLRRAPVPFPAHSLSRFKPPIAPLS